MDLCKEKQISGEERDILIISFFFWSFVKRLYDQEKRFINIMYHYVLSIYYFLFYWHLPEKTHQSAAKKSTYAPALAHIELLDSLFKAGTGHDHYPEWESSGIIPARAIPSAHRSCAVAFAPSSKWTMGVLRAF